MVTTPSVTRQPRSESTLPALDDIEERNAEARVAMTDDDADKSKGQTPEEALAEAQRVIAVKDAENERLRQRATSAEAEAVKAGKTALDAREAQIRDQGIAIENSITAAEGKRAAATAKLREARANNDTDAEAEAISSLSDAGAELSNARQTKTRFDAWKENAKKATPTARAHEEQPRPGTAQDGPSQEAQKWLGEHPRYFRDPDYAADALALHQAALALNITEGSKQYVEHIDAGLEKIYGKNHGQLDRKGTQVTTQDTRKPRQAPNRSTTAAPPSRGGDEYRGGGEFEYTHSDGARLRLVSGVDQNGKPYETVQGTIPAEWREFAKVNRMGDVAYAVEQLKIQREMQPGGDYEGLTYHQNGVYRA